jgi:hypothetical protein
MKALRYLAERLYNREEGVLQDEDTFNERGHLEDQEGPGIDALGPDG